MELLGMHIIQYLGACFNCLLDLFLCRCIPETETYSSSGKRPYAPMGDGGTMQPYPCLNTCAEKQHVCNLCIVQTRKINADNAGTITHVLRAYYPEAIIC